MTIVDCPPDLVIIRGSRPLFSLVGIVLAAVGYWIMEKKWDDQGSEAYHAVASPGGGNKTISNTSTNNNNNNNYQLNKPSYVAPDTVDRIKKNQDNDSEDKSAVLIRVTSQDTSNSQLDNDNNNDEGFEKLFHSLDMENPFQITNPNKPPILDKSSTSAAAHAVMIPPIELKKAFPTPKIFVFGCIIWAISFMFAPDPDFPNATSKWDYLSMICVGALTIIIAIHLRKSTIESDLELKIRAVGAMMVTWLLLAIAVLAEKDTNAPWYYPFGGVFFIMLSYVILWRSRKMGESWDKRQRPNPNFAVPNIGTVYFFFGMFLVWIAMNAVSMADVRLAYFPIYISFRTFLSFLAGIFIIVPGTLAIDYAWEEGSTRCDKFYQLDGSTLRHTFTHHPLYHESMPVAIMANMLESPNLIMFGWILFGLTSWVPVRGCHHNGFTFQKLFSFLLPVCIGLMESSLVRPAYWDQNITKYRRYTGTVWAVMLLLAMTIGISEGGSTLTLSMFGIFFIMLGPKIVLFEGKRWNEWLHDTPRQTSRPTVYGAGYPIYIIGWILLCLAMSIPM